MMQSQWRICEQLSRSRNFDKGTNSREFGQSCFKLGFQLCGIVLSFGDRKTPSNYAFIDETLNLFVKQKLAIVI